MYELISFLSRSKNRRTVLKNLEKPTTPTELSSKLKIQRSTISRAILELMDKKLVKCLTPKEKMGRLYQITDLGKKILKENDTTKFQFDGTTNLNQDYVFTNYHYEKDPKFLKKYFIPKDYKKVFTIKRGNIIINEIYKKN